ncbi:MAG: hypothetical protein WDW36_001184 [Sanguina aurantia]
MEGLVQEAKDEADRNELLIWACARGLIEDATELLRLGADPAAATKDGHRASHFAASHGHTDLLELFMARGVDLEAEDKRGRAPLHYAAAGRRAAALTFLLSRSAWHDSADDRDDTALHLAARAGSLPCVKALLQAGATADLVNRRGLTAFGEAAAMGHVGVMTWMAGSGGATGHVAAKDLRARSYSLLHLTVGLGHTAASQALLTLGADVHDRSNGEEVTALHAAALGVSLADAALLLKAGADRASYDADGACPVDLVPRSDQQKKDRSLPGASRAAALAKLKTNIAELSKLLEVPAAKAAPVDTPAANRFFPGKGTFAGGKAGAQEADAAAATAARSRTSLGRKQGGAEAVDPDESLSSRFSKMSPQEQLRKVNLYAAMAVEELERVAGLPSSAVDPLRQVKRITDVLGGFRAIAALRGDEDFQSDVVDPQVKKAMDYMKATNDMNKYKDDRTVMSVSFKLRKLQNVLRVNGGLKVTLDDLLVGPAHPANTPAATQARIASLEGTLAAATRVATDAIAGSARVEPPHAGAGRGGAGGKSGLRDLDPDPDLGEDGDEAAAAAAGLHPRPPPAPAGDSPPQRASAPPSTPAQPKSILRKRGEAGLAGGGRPTEGGSGGGSDGTPAHAPGPAPGPGPHTREHTWENFLVDLLAQTLRAALICVASLAAMWVLGCLPGGSNFPKPATPGMADPSLQLPPNLLLDADSYDDFNEL